MRGRAWMMDVDVVDGTRHIFTGAMKYYVLLMILRNAVKAISCQIPMNSPKHASAPSNISPVKSQAVPLLYQQDFDAECRARSRLHNAS